MSSAMKEWVQDRAVEALWNANVIDKIETTKIKGNCRCEVHGYRRGEPVAFMVWLNNDGEWQFEHRELDT